MVGGWEQTKTKTKTKKEKKKRERDRRSQTTNPPSTRKPKTRPEEQALRLEYF
jgi:hypothetical protein